MQNLTVKSFLLILLVSVWIGSTFSVILAQNERQLAVVNEMKKLDPTIRIRWDQQTGIPTHLTGKLTPRIEGDALEIAQQFFKQNAPLFKMTDSEKELKKISLKEDARGWQHIRLQQVYKSFPVEGKTILVHINDAQEVQVVSGHYLPEISLDTTVSVPKEKAIQTARKHLSPQLPLQEDPSGELVVYSHQGKNYLAWKLLLVSLEPLGEFIYYVDAHTGDVIHSYNDLKIARDRQTYDANNGTSLPGTLERSEGDGPVGDAALDAAHDNTGKVYDFYKIRFGRDSYDNAGATIVSTVHYRSNYNNAFWSPSRQQIVYGDGDGTLFSPLCQALDVVAHELTHAVTENESNLVYQYQSGALNEALSDIFAAVLDSADWMIGEDIYTPGTPGDALRYMNNPPLSGQPDHMDDYVVTDSDNGGVHINNGIPNKAAFLMADGGTHHGITVLGMGRKHTGKVFYEAQVNWFTSNAQFIDARDATLDAVAAIYPGDISKYNTVQNAWAAVGVGTPVSSWALELTPSPVKVDDEGGTTTLTALVTNVGSPVAGATVNFTSANTTRATVAPASGTTAANGRVQVTVTGHDAGNTIITSIATDGTNTTTATVQVKVPTTSEIGLFILILAVGLVLFIRLKRYPHSVNKI